MVFIFGQHHIYHLICYLIICIHCPHIVFTEFYNFVRWNFSQKTLSCTSTSVPLSQYCFIGTVNCGKEIKKFIIFPCHSNNSLTNYDTSISSGKGKCFQLLQLLDKLVFTHSSTRIYPPQLQNGAKCQTGIPTVSENIILFMMKIAGKLHYHSTSLSNGRQKFVSVVVLLLF